MTNIITMNNAGRIHIVLCPTLDIAKAMKEEAAKKGPLSTVECEYGDYLVPGNEMGRTLAHHGSRAGNHAPCVEQVEPMAGGTILVSHVDLDTIGGVLALMGLKPDYPDCPDFWNWAEYIDVFGPHHLHTLRADIRARMGAMYAWSSKRPRFPRDAASDITDEVLAFAERLEQVLDTQHPNHAACMEEGMAWEREILANMQSRLVRETDYLRAFLTDGISCAAGYYSPAQGRLVEATVTFNTKFGSITVGFADGGAKVSAEKLVQRLWGEGAGGRDGIAGSPRGQRMTEADFAAAIDAVEKALAAV